MKTFGVLRALNCESSVPTRDFMLREMHALGGSSEHVMHSM